MVCVHPKLGIVGTTMRDSIGHSSQLFTRNLGGRGPPNGACDSAHLAIIHLFDRSAKPVTGKSVSQIGVKAILRIKES
jgi:hypothetical protein